MSNSIPRSNLVLNDMEKTLIRKAGITIHYPGKHTVFAVGDISDRVYLIENGWVNMYRLSTEGRKVSVGSIRNPGELMGLSETILGINRTCFAYTIGNVSMVMMSKQIFEQLMEEHSFLSIKAAKLLGARMREAEGINYELVCRQAPGRLALMLMRMGERMGKQTNNGTCLNLNITHEEIANMVGTSRQTVTSLLNTFKQEKSVIFEGRAIRVIYPDKLAKWVV